MIDQTSQFFAILTTVGAAKQANADALGVPWKLTEMGVGDANGTDPTPNAAQTALINEWRRRPLNQLFVDPLNPAVIVAEQVIPADEGGKWIREMGLYDADGDLVAVANCPPSFKPVMTQGSGRVQVVRMNFIVGSAGNITLKIDPSVVLATREFVERRIIEELYKLDNKQSVRAATTANIALTGLQAVDGISLQAGDRVLVKNQVSAKDNGIYIVGVAAWQRAADADSSAEVTSAMILSVEQGATLADTRWQLVTDGTIVLGTTALAFQNITQGFAPLSSPALLGIPTAPTAAPAANNSQIANTAFVRAALSSVGLGDVSLLANIADMNDVTVPSGIYYVSGGSTLNNPVPTANGTVIHRIYGGGGLQIYQTYANNELYWRRRTPTQWEPWNSIASLDSPVFVGNPTAPTPAQFDKDKSLATTEFVKRTGLEYGDYTNYGATATLTAADIGKVSAFASAGPMTATLPTGPTIPRGAVVKILCAGGSVTVTVAAGDSIDAVNIIGNIPMALGDTAEFIRIGSLWRLIGGSVLLKYSAVMSGPNWITPPQFDKSKSLATAEFVQRSGLQYSGFLSFQGALTGQLTHIGGVVHFHGSGSNSYSLPDSAVNGLPVGATIRLQNWGIGPMALAVQGTDKMQENIDNSPTGANRSIPPDTYVDCIYIGARNWLLAGTGVVAKTRPWGCSLGQSWHQKLPSGLIIQSFTAQFSAAAKSAAFNLPIAFPSAHFGCTVTLTDSAIYDSSGSPFAAGMPNGLGQVLLQSNYTASQSALRVLAFGM
jgi:hypothetical protein